MLVSNTFWTFIIADTIYNMQVIDVNCNSRVAEDIYDIFIRNILW
jgi:hypothetical protein